MTEIIRMAREAELSKDGFGAWLAMDKDLERFAQLLLQAERERIAKQIDRMPFGDTAASFAVWIRAGAP